MAKRSTVEFFNAFNDTELSFDQSFVQSATSSRIVLRDAETGARLVFEGEGLKTGPNFLGDGVVDSLKAFTAGNRIALDVSDVRIDLGRLEGDDFGDRFSNFAEKTFAQDNRVIGSQAGEDLFSGAGRDIVIGRGGDDDLQASEGNDVMSGGKGNDVFDFQEGMGRDVITDFDARGGFDAQDLLGGSFSDVVAVDQKGRDTVVRFESGDQFILLDTRANQIDEADFQSFYL